LSDFVRPLSLGISDTVGVFAATANTEIEQFYGEDPYKQLLAQTLADRLAEAGTEKMHEYVRKTAWGYAKNENLSIKELLSEKFQGIRPAVGYPSLPDQSVNFILNNILDMSRIGITLTQNGAMNPHASVCGLMIAHPSAHYFSVGKIDGIQLSDYAIRRGKTVEEIRKFLNIN
jgi:cobalamin-dependent methionine synthase I